MRNSRISAAHYVRICPAPNKYYRTIQVTTIQTLPPNIILNSLWRKQSKNLRRHPCTCNLTIIHCVTPAFEIQKTRDLVLDASALLCATSERLGLFGGIGAGAFDGLSGKFLAGVGGADFVIGGACLAEWVLSWPDSICFALWTALRCLAKTRSVHDLFLLRSLPTTSAKATIQPSFSAALSA